MSIPLNINLQQILLHVANLLILFLVLYFVLYKPVVKFMDKRDAHYKEIDKAAEDKLAAASATEAEYTKRMEETEQEIAARRSEAQKALAAESEAQAKEARDKAEQIIVDARKTAEAEHDRIIAEAQDEIRVLAIDAAQKLVSDDPYDQFLDLVEEGSK